MANPFPARFDSKCQSCGNNLLEGDTTYAHDGMFIGACCIPSGNICTCTNYKKDGYDSCYECFNA